MTLDQAFDTLDELRTYEQAATAGMEDEWLEAKYAEDVETYDSMHALDFDQS